MQPRTPIIERAFALARSGSCQKVTDIRAKLRVEGYAQIDDYISGSVAKELKQLCSSFAVAESVETAGPIDTQF